MRARKGVSDLVRAWRRFSTVGACKSYDFSRVFEMEDLVR